MRVTSGVQNAALRVGHVRHNADQAEPVHETNGLFACAFQAEGQHTATAVGQVLLGQCRIHTVGIVGIVHPGHTRVGLEESGHGVGVLARKYGMDLYANEKTWKAMESKNIGVIKQEQKHLFEPGVTKTFGDIDVMSFAVSHDAASPQFYSFQKFLDA